MDSYRLSDGLTELAIEVQHRLEVAASARASVAPGTKAVLARLIEQMKIEGCPTNLIRRAESISIDLHQLEWNRMGGKDQTLNLLTSARDAARLLLRPQPREVPQEQRGELLLADAVDGPNFGDASDPSTASGSGLLNLLGWQARRSAA